MKASSLNRRSRTKRFVQFNFISVSLYEKECPFTDADEDVPGSIDPWQAVAPIRPDTPYVRASRWLDRIGEALAAFVLVVGGPGLIGIASLVEGIV